MIRAIGALTGQNKEGDALAERTQKQIEDAVAKYSGAEYKDFVAPTVYYVSGYGQKKAVSRLPDPAPVRVSSPHSGKKA